MSNARSALHIARAFPYLLARSSVRKPYLERILRAYYISNARSILRAARVVLIWLLSAPACAIDIVLSSTRI